MSRRKEINPNQGVMIIHDGRWNTENVVDVAVLPEAVTPDPEPGAYVDLMTRNIQLDEVLMKMSAASSRRGMQAALASPSRRPEITRKYGPASDHVARQASKNASRFDRSGRWLFSEAAGLTSMVQAGTPREEAEAITSGLYQEFATKFTGPDNNENRQQTRKKLKKQAKALGKITAQS